MITCGKSALTTQLDLSAIEYPLVMGIVNITPDSFSDGGRLFQSEGVDLDAVLRTVDSMVADGADVIDVGGESTRPGARSVSVSEELDRVIPVLEAIDARFDIAVSVDTSSADVISAAAGAGASLINDVRALRREGALRAAAATGLSVCLMHMQGEPDSMQVDPSYRDVVAEVKQFLLARVESCEAAGIDRDRVILDPGFGFGKTLQHNLALFRALPQLVQTGFPVLVGVSRKRMIGAMLARDGVAREVSQRVTGSVALAMLAAQRGAALLRVHDVKQTVDALRMLSAVEEM